jgi:hypothetical protein
MNADVEWTGKSVHIGVNDVELHLCGAKRFMNYLFENIT